MDDAERIKILEATFQYMEQTILATVDPYDEKATRTNIKNKVEEDLRNVNDSFHRTVIVEAYRRLEQLSYGELVDMLDLLEEPDDVEEEEEKEDEYDLSQTFDLDLPMRVRLFESDMGDKIVILNDKGERVVYELEGRFIYQDAYYLKLKVVPQNAVEEVKADKQSFFFEHVLENDPNDDKLVQITDKELLKVLKEEHEFLYSFEIEEAEKNRKKNKKIRGTSMEKYIPDPINLEGVELPQDILDLAELISKNVHEVWSKMRLEEGWVYGEKRNDDLKTNPCLVPYEDLPEEEKAYDRNTAIETLKLIVKLGYRLEKVQ